MKNRFLAKLLRVVSPLTLLFVATVANANLITNGDFESGDQDFITDYTLDIGAHEQHYNVTTDPKLHHPAAASYGDNTSGSGLMMAVNGSTVNSLVWGQEVNLTANTEYEFSIWVSSWYPSSPANLVFDIGGISLGSFVAPSQTAKWVRYSFTFNSGATSGSVSLNIIDKNRALVGNDFALDDISLVVVDSTVDYKLPNNQWRMISLPAIPPSNENTVKQVFGGSLGNDITDDDYGVKWAVYQYYTPNDTQDTDKANSYGEPLKLGHVLEQGRGYWIIQATGSIATLKMPAGSSEASDTYAFEIASVTGSDTHQWTLSGNPFSTPQKLGDFFLKTDSSDCATPCDLDNALAKKLLFNIIWTYSGDEYVLKNKQSELSPWDGFWTVSLERSLGLSLSLQKYDANK